MELENHEIRKIWYTIKACEDLMQKELENKKEILTPVDLETAKNELAALSKLFKKVTKEKLGPDINPFTHYSKIYFPNI